MIILSAKDCKVLIEGGDVLAIDIREKYEYDSGNCGFRNIPMADLQSALQNQDRLKSIVLMCNSGKRAQAAGNLLEMELGFGHIIILKNGIQGWKEMIDPTLVLE